MEVSKDDVGLELEELEAAAIMVQEETELEIVNRLREIRIDEK